MESKKYELLEDDFVLEGNPAVKLHRIRALRDVASVAKKGELGGYIEREANLSHEGAAWVGNKARVYLKGFVGEDALVTGAALVCCSAQVLGDAHVRGTAKLYDEVIVTGKTIVEDCAKLFGNVHVSGHAIIAGNAVLYGTIQVGEFAEIRDKAGVTGDARIGGYAKLHEDAHVSGGVIAGDAVLGGKMRTKASARILSRADICSVDVSDANGALTAYRTEARQFAMTLGPFTGSLEELRKMVHETWSTTEDKRAKLLLNLASVIEQHFAV